MNTDTGQYEELATIKALAEREGISESEASERLIGTLDPAIFNATPEDAECLSKAISESKEQLARLRAETEKRERRAQG